MRWRWFVYGLIISLLLTVGATCTKVEEIRVALITILFLGVIMGGLGLGIPTNFGHHELGTDPIHFSPLTALRLGGTVAGFLVGVMLVSLRWYVLLWFS